MMIKKIEICNIALIALMGILIISTLLSSLLGTTKLFGILFYATLIIIPIILAAKGFEFLLKNEQKKALVSLLLLSFAYMLSIILVFI